MSSVVDLWDAASAACVAVAVNESAGITTSNCCRGGSVQSADLPRSAGILIAWLLILCWIFLGVALGADVFMSSIEKITSAERTKEVVTQSGKVKVFHYRVWNETMANLTLMALGSSAPEILINILEVFVGNFHAGALGPSTIVGSAAFNLFVITAVCVVCIPSGESRSIKGLGVFLVTSFFSIIAYVWLLLMVKYISPDLIELWEALVTCGLMAVLLAIAYKVDRLNAPQYTVNTQGIVLRPATDGADSAPQRASTRPRVSRSSDLYEAARHAGLIMPMGDGDDDEAAESIAAQIRQMAPGRTKAYYRRQVIGEQLAVNKKVRRNSTPVTASELHSIYTQQGTPNASPQQEQIGAPRMSASLEGIVAPPEGLIRFVSDDVKVMESSGSVVVEVERMMGARGEVTVQYATKNQQALASKDYEERSGTLSFKEGESGPLEITIPIMDDEDFEKDETFTVVLSDIAGGAIFDPNTDGGMDRTICTVTIVNDDVKARRFAKACALLKMDMDGLDLAEASWAEQIRDVFTCPEKGETLSATLWSVSLSVLTAPWRLMFALVPPPSLGGGWACFCLCLAAIGLQVVFISDFANQMGCQMGLTPSITAITFVAMGTSLPDLFASMKAAQDDKYADNSVGNVTGSNSVNVFGGLGVPWLIGAAYWASHQEATQAWIDRYPDIYARGGVYTKGGFVVRSGDLGFSVLLFAVFALITIATVLWRRPRELGGSNLGKYATMALFVGLWLLYVLLSSFISLGTITSPI